LTELLTHSTRPLQPGLDRRYPLGITSTGYFTAPGGPILVGTPVINALAGSSVDSFRLTQLLGDNQARIIQVIWRVRWYASIHPQISVYFPRRDVLDVVEPLFTLGGHEMLEQMIAKRLSHQVVLL
jgi:hypothetical protein